MSPFSQYLYDLRTRMGIGQSELALRLGYGQSYISALEIGVKGPPPSHFIGKLAQVLSLSEVQLVEMHQAADASHRKIVLGPEDPSEVYWMLKELRDQIDKLHPIQVRMIREALRLKDDLVSPKPGAWRAMRRKHRRSA